jgi:hypothetical protein
LVNNTVVGYLSAGGAGSVSMSNVLAATLAPDTLYTLSLDVGKRLDFANGWTASGYTVELLANGVALPLTGVNLDPTAGYFTNLLYTYTSGPSVTPGQVLSIQLSKPAGLTQVLFDNVALDTTLVPEPSALLLVIVGGCLAWRRMRK